MAFTAIETGQKAGDEALQIAVDEAQEVDAAIGAIGAMSASNASDFCENSVESSGISSSLSILMGC